LNDNYTQYNSDSIYKFLDEDDASEAIDFIKDPSNFRTFNEGLSEIMIKKGYISDSTAPDEISQILYKKLTDIGSSLSLNTISSWIKGDHRPKVEAGYRKNIYEICYALNLTFNETIWFFHHVYYDRAFNCHTIDESVYYYCLKNNIAYKDSLDIIKEIENSPDITSSYEETSNYTLFIQKTIDKIESVDELITFLTLNKANFKSWNASAYQTLDDLVKDLLPSENGKKEIEKIKRKIKATHSIYGIIPKKNNQNEWGLIMQEFFYDLTDESYLDILDGKNIRSKNFLLEQILGMKLITDKEKKRFIDKASIPDIVKNNFPSRKTMSDVLSEDKITQSKSYDSIRKLIILLEFYRYWCSIKIMDEEYDDFENPLSDAFIDEINYTLYLCGYEEMYAGNPYDWIFMCSAQADDPLSYFRQCITFILDE
jgi:hypothetical protein